MPIIFLKNLVVLPTLTFIGETLPATIGVPFSQDISGQASGGTLPYTFSLLASTGDSYTVSPAGVINGVPGQQFQATNAAVLLVTDTGIQLVT